MKYRLFHTSAFNRKKIISGNQNTKPRVIALNSFTNDFFNSLDVREKLPEFTFFILRK